MALGGPGGARGPGGQGGPARALKKRPARSLKSARCTLSRGAQMGSGRRVKRLGFTLGTSTGPEENLLRQDVGATVPMAVGRRANVLDRSAPSRSRGLSAAHPRRWAA